MSIKRKIVKILFLALWLTISGSVLVLLVAARKIKSNKHCRGVEVDISGVEEFYFLDKHDILAIIEKQGSRHPEGKPIAAFDLRQLEAMLKKNIWVKDAELFFDNNLVLHVNVYEREPVARVFTTKGSSFFVDSTGFRMPLSNKMVVKLPVFTGFTEGNSEVNSADSLLLQHVKKVGYYILNNEFWMAQVAQVDILPDGNFEMVPTIGNHIIQFGKGEDVESKFKRLFIFYRQVSGPAGFDKYSRLNVQYNNQLVATRKNVVSKGDSLLASRNIEKMIRETGTKKEDSTPLLSGSKIRASHSSDSSHPAKEKIRQSTVKVPTEMKKSTISTNKAAVKPAAKSSPATSETKPKAVMRKIETQK